MILLSEDENCCSKCEHLISKHKGICRANVFQKGSFTEIELCGCEERF